MTETVSKISLSDIPLFKGLLPQQVKNLQSHIHEKHFQKGEVMFLEGKRCEQIFIVRSGKVKIFCSGASGKEQILEVLDPGDSCACNPGESSWCCSSSAQAMTDCSVWILPRDEYLNMVKSNGKMTVTLTHLFADRIRKLNSLVEEVSLIDPQYRLVRFLLDLAGENHKANGESGLVVALTHEEISQRLGLVRETVTRHLQRLKKKQLIDLKPRKIIIRDIEGMAKIIS